jgi:hypothetical protein
LLLTKRFGIASWAEPITGPLNKAFTCLGKNRTDGHFGPN